MFLEDMVTRRMKNTGEGRQAAVMAIKSYLCQHFVYGVDQYYHTMVNCRLRGKAAGPRRPSEEAMQALGAHLAEGSGVDA